MSRNPIILIGALCTGVLVHSQDAPPAKSVTGDAADVAIHWRGPEPGVDVVLGSHGPYHFAIDTGGAGDARADSSLVKALSLETIGEARGSSGGTVQTMPIVLVPELTLGGITWKNLQAPSRDYNRAADLPPIAGILGADAFKDFLLTIDFPRGRVQISRGDLPEPDGRTISAVDLSRRVPMISIDVSGHQLQAVIDTGNVTPELLILPAALASQLPLSAPASAASAVTSVSGRANAATAELAGALTVGGIVVSHPRILFVDGVASANLGDTFLRSYALTLDLKNKRIRLSAPSR